MSACNIAGPQVRTLALSACRGPWARRGLARRGAICQWMGQQQHQVPASQEAGAHLGRSWAGAPATRRSVAASALAPAEAPKAAAAYAEELHAAVEAVQLASRLCQVGGHAAHASHPRRPPRPPFPSAAAPCLLFLRSQIPNSHALPCQPLLCWHCWPHCPSQPAPAPPCLWAVSPNRPTRCRPVACRRQCRCSCSGGSGRTSRTTAPSR